MIYTELNKELKTQLIVILWRFQSLFVRSCISRRPRSKGKVSIECISKEGWFKVFPFYELPLWQRRLKFSFFLNWVEKLTTIFIYFFNWRIHLQVIPRRQIFHFVSYFNYLFVASFSLCCYLICFLIKL